MRETRTSGSVGRGRKPPYPIGKMLRARLGGGDCDVRMRTASVRIVLLEAKVHVAVGAARIRANGNGWIAAWRVRVASGNRRDGPREAVIARNDRGVLATATLVRYVDRSVGANAHMAVDATTLGEGVHGD
jgi:hypothetical protein